MATSEPTAELIREPGKFQPGKLGDLLFILHLATHRLLTLGSKHVRSGVTDPGEIFRMAGFTKHALEMWLELVPCNNYAEILDLLRRPLSRSPETEDSCEAFLCHACLKMRDHA